MDQAFFLGTSKKSLNFLHLKKGLSYLLNTYFALIAVVLILLTVTQTAFAYLDHVCCNHF